MKFQGINLIFGVLASLVGFITLIIRDDVAYSIGLKSPLTISVASAAIILYGIGATLYSYLQGNSIRINFPNIDTPLATNKLQEQIDFLKLEIYKFNDANSEVNKSEIEVLIRELINKSLNNEEFTKVFEAKFLNQLSEEQKISRINQDFVEINRRIGFEIVRLSKSANINLVFGSITTLIAVGFLGYEVLYKPVNFTEMVPLLSHYIPRITIVIFVEVFAFFFLKIYKANLNDIKYFHNEKTNIDLKLVAIKAAIATKNETIIQTSITELAKTERNFILKKDESTIEIEKERLDFQSSKSVLDALKDIIKSK